MSAIPRKRKQQITPFIQIASITPRLRIHRIHCTGLFSFHRHVVHVPTRSDG